MVSVISKIFPELGWKPTTVNKGVCVYVKENQIVYILLATDDILLLSKMDELLKELLDKFG